MEMLKNTYTIYIKRGLLYRTEILISSQPRMNKLSSIQNQARRLITVAGQGSLHQYNKPGFPLIEVEKQAILQLKNILHLERNVKNKSNSEHLKHN